MNQRLSSLRSELRTALDQLPSLLQACFEREPLLPGSLYTLRRKCGKPGCRCAQGDLHESTVLSYRGQGKPKNISPSPEQLDAIRTMTNSYRRARTARAALVRAQKLLLQLVDQLESHRVELGKAEFQKQSSARTRKPRS